MIHKKSCKKQKKDDLGQLSRLKLHKSQIDPSCGAVCRRSEKTDDQKKNNICPIHDPLKVTDPGIIDQGQDYHHHKSHHNAGKLLDHQIFSGRSNKKNSCRTDGKQEDQQSEIIKS